ncbi:MULTISPECIES: hypothetical protein [Acinetobacter]|jgi:hypothetical protein|uniref:Uncharacterized protein n=1 Tax=Acinetobacter lwoffii NIPH 478 TaxID=1217668 RepID=N9H9X9_ACILW|nr:MULTISPECIES: hypothetical protein [Acinetobacter]ENW28625.1 hypothetical protein F923_02597 [Acinetobacter lwoffii NIPH 478]MDT0198939.1 hypothetical protein [Acinetobacter sp. RG5]MDT0230581.1 hypothetical protein [Acinetobacter sp. RRD8]
MKKYWESVNKCFLFNLTNWFLLIAGLINLGVGTWSSYSGNAPIAITSLTAGLVLLFAATIDRFESLKGLGVEAKTRQLDKKLEEADNALIYLKEMTAITAKTLVEIQSNIGRFDGAPTPEKFIQFADDIRKIMKKTGSNEQDIQEVLKPWAKTLCMDLSFKKIMSLRAALSEKTKELDNQIRAIPQPINSSTSSYYTDLLQKQSKISTYLQNDLSKLHLLEIDDYPEKLLKLYDEAPYLEEEKIENLKNELELFIPEMKLLKSERKVDDKYLWIRALKET